MSQAAAVRANPALACALQMALQMALLRAAFALGLGTFVPVWIVRIYASDAERPRQRPLHPAVLVCAATIALLLSRRAGVGVRA